jgi:hypothetical protein
MAVALIPTGMIHAGVMTGMPIGRRHRRMRAMPTAIGVARHGCAAHPHPGRRRADPVQHECEAEQGRQERAGEAHDRDSSAGGGPRGAFRAGKVGRRGACRLRHAIDFIDRGGVDSGFWAGADSGEVWLAVCSEKSQTSMPNMSLHQTSSNRVARSKSWLREYRLEILVLTLGLIAMNLIFIAKAFRASGVIDPAAAGQLGDFVGGYVGTFFALASVVLLAATLRNQTRSAQMLQFEAKYFELLRLHRDNVAEMAVQEVKSRKVFVAMTREYRYALEITKKIAESYDLCLGQRKLSEIAYYSIYYGTGDESNRMLFSSLTEFPIDFVQSLVKRLEDPQERKRVQSEGKLGYVPFEGHQSRLGHYYRHLYQAVRYVDQQTINIDKYQYVKTIRAQLSNHEQALLLLNSLAPIGRSWWRQGYMLRYRMAQNLPKEFFDSDKELDMSLIFPKGYFGWEEGERAAPGPILANGENGEFR